MIQTSQSLDYLLYLMTSHLTDGIRDNILGISDEHYHPADEEDLSQ